MTLSRGRLSIVLCLLPPTPNPIPTPTHPIRYVEELRSFALALQGELSAAGGGNVAS